MKIYDCFKFLNELDLLEIRLNELDSVVDKFVLVEFKETHTGKPKPLYFDEIKNTDKRFSKFLDKIIHIGLEANPKITNARRRDVFQRNAVKLGLSKCKPNDVIIVSDLDEIPAPDKIKSNLPDINGKNIVEFRQHNYRYFFNCRVNNPPPQHPDWSGSRMIRYKNFAYGQDFRLLTPEAKQRMGKVTYVEDGGWHFSWMGGVDAIIEKLGSFSHTEQDLPENREKDVLLYRITNGFDYCGRDAELKHIYIYGDENLDESYPKYLLKNLNKFKKYIFYEKDRVIDEELKQKVEDRLKLKTEIANIPEKNLLE